MFSAPLIVEPHFGLYVDRGLQGQKVDVLIYDDVLRIEQEDQLIVSYPCVYNPRQRRIISVNEKGRQQYRRFRILPLKLFTLDMVRWVWRLPRYRRFRGRQRGFQRRQLNLFERDRRNRFRFRFICKTNI